MNVVFNTNFSGMAGLGATLVSLLRNCSDRERVRLHVLCSGLSPADKAFISDMARREGYFGSPAFIDYDAESKFGHLRALHGDYTTYGKSLIPELIDEDIVLYLDTDLVVTLDVLDVLDHAAPEYPIAAASSATMRHAYDRNFLTRTLGIGEDEAYFNAGVLLFNRPAYRQQDFAGQWDRLCERHAADFAVVDQTLFNAICRGRFHRLPARFNRSWTPDVDLDPGEEPPSIFHFVGSPKPWDLYGSRVHSGYDLWRSYTPDDWLARYCGWSRQQVRRTWHIRRSIIRHLLP